MGHSNNDDDDDDDDDDDAAGPSCSPTLLTTPLSAPQSSAGPRPSGETRNWSHGGNHASKVVFACCTLST